MDTQEPILFKLGMSYLFRSLADRWGTTVNLTTNLLHSLRFVCWLVGCLTSQQHASVSQGRICSDNFTCCHTEIEVADQTFYLTQSQYTDTGPTSPSADPITPSAWQGSHWSGNFEVTGMTRPPKNPVAGAIRTRDLPLSRRTPYHLANEAVHSLRFSAFRSSIFHSRPVHSLMLSSHRFLCLPLRLPPWSIPWHVDTPKDFPLLVHRHHDGFLPYLWHHSCSSAVGVSSLL